MSSHRDFHPALAEQGGESFLYHEKKCALIPNQRDQHDHLDYSESSSNSSIVSSANCSCTLSRDPQNPQSSSPAPDTDDCGTPENLSSRTQDNDDKSLILKQSPQQIPDEDSST